MRAGKGKRAVLKLFRYSSFVGLIALVAVTVALSWFYRRLAFDALVETETRANVALTKAFANSIWPSYAAFVGAGREDPTRRAAAAGTRSAGSRAS